MLRRTFVALKRTVFTYCIFVSCLEPMFNWRHENPVESPFVAHLSTKPLPEPERRAFEVHNWPISTFSDPPKDPRPVTAPNPRAQQRRSLLHTSSTESADGSGLDGVDGLDGTTPTISRPSTGRTPRKRANVHSAGGVRSAGRTRSNDTQSSMESLTDNNSLQEELPTSQVPAEDPSSVVPPADENAPGFNPLRPSVFAASLMSDPNLARRQSTVESLATFASSMSRIEPPGKLASVTEEAEASNSGKLGRSPKVNPKLRQMMHRQTSERSRFSADGGDSVSSSGKMSSKSSSFSSLPAVDGVPSPMQNKSKSMKMMAGGSGRF